MAIRKRNGRMLKWAGIGVAGFVTMIVLYIVVLWIFGSRLERRLAAIRAAGDPTSLSEYRMEEVAPEENAATYLDRASSDAKLLYRKLNPLWQNRPQQPTYLDDTEIEAIESAFAAYPNVIPLLEQAANCPAYSVDFSQDVANAGDTTKALMENVEQKRMFARLLYRDHFVLLLSKNKHDEAVRSCVTLLKLSQHIEKDPAIINFQANGCVFRWIAIQNANEALQSGPVSENVRQELENELAKINIRHSYLQALKTERACVLDNFEAMMRGGMVWFPTRHKHDCLDVLDWLIARAEATLPENASNPPANLSPTPPTTGTFGSMLLTTLQAAETATNRVEAEVRVLRVINALAPRDDPGKPPLPDLSDLGLPKSAIIDPFNGKPLIVKKVDGGWLVYSVGENKVDDGGDVDDSQSSKTLDIGLRPIVRSKAVPEEREHDPE